MNIRQSVVQAVFNYCEGNRFPLTTVEVAVLTSKWSAL